MAKITVEVCAGTHCVMMGSMNIIDAVHSLQELSTGHKPACEVEVVAVPCTSQCKQEDVNGPFVKVNGKLIAEAESETVMAAIMDVCIGAQNK